MAGARRSSPRLVSTRGDKGSDQSFALASRRAAGSRVDARYRGTDRAGSRADGTSRCCHARHGLRRARISARVAIAALSLSLFPIESNQNHIGFGVASESSERLLKGDSLDHPAHPDSRTHESFGRAAFGSHRSISLSSRSAMRAKHRGAPRIVLADARRRAIPSADISHLSPARQSCRSQRA